MALSGPQAFGRTVRRERRDRDMTQEKLGEAADIGAKHISEIERGTRDVRLSTILRIADGLQMRPGELFVSVEQTYERAQARVVMPVNRAFTHQP